MQAGADFCGFDGLLTGLLVLKGSTGLSSGFQEGCGATVGTATWGMYGELLLHSFYEPSR